MTFVRFFLLLSCLTTWPVWAEAIQGLTLHIQRSDPATLRLWIGDYGRSTAVAAFATQKGIVVVDTLGLPAADRELRRIIAREFKRNDFKVLINTHEHGDHTLGNEVYADCTILAHARCVDGMKTQLAFHPRWVEALKEEIQLHRSKLARPDQGPVEAGLRDALRIAELNLATFQGVKITYPTQTFEDRFTLNMGDTTFELSYAGGIHSASDIWIAVPERDLLMTGDVMVDGWLSEERGCGASFRVDGGIAHDFPKLLRNWETLLGHKDRIRTLWPGHWNATLSLKGLEQRAAYIRNLYEGVQAFAKAEQPAALLGRSFPLQPRFPELVGSPDITARDHGITVFGLYAAVTGTESAARKLNDLVAIPGSESECQRILKDLGRKPASYYFIEGEFNYYGYQWLQARQPTLAVRLFEAWTEAYPDSWNAHDSLAEAYQQLGDVPKARRHYERSLALNPGNTNAKAMLAKLDAPSVPPRDPESE